MNIYPLLGILAIFYALFVIYVAVKKPSKIWNIAKIRGFRKVLGEKGTVIFFIIWAVIFIGLGIWLFTL